MILPNGITTSNDVRWDGGSGGYLLFLGRFDVRVKGLDILVRSLADIPEGERPTLRLHGPDHRGGKKEIDGLRRRLRLDRWISIGDPIYGRDKQDAIEKAAACTYPSRVDAWPIAVTEAVGAGVPTLVADYPLGRLLEPEEIAHVCLFLCSELAGAVTGAAWSADGGTVQIIV